MASSVDVVDYVAAMEQCGDDREFLCELLHDLKAELDTQLCNIQENLEHGLDSQRCDAIRRAAHVIKGASANLCCYGLQHSASALEQSAKGGHQDLIKQDLTKLQAEATKFVQYLQRI